MKLFFLSILCFFVFACAGPTGIKAGESRSTWDFDHQLQFKITKYDNNHYRVEVIKNHKVSFERLSAFLLRKGYAICNARYGFKIVIIKGIESIDVKRENPNLIIPNLTADIECPNN